MSTRTVARYAPGGWRAQLDATHEDGRRLVVAPLAYVPGRWRRQADVERHLLTVAAQRQQELGHGWSVRYRLYPQVASMSNQHRMDSLATAAKVGVGLAVGVVLLLGWVAAAVWAHRGELAGGLLVALLVAWFVAGRAGVCPGFHCPGCKCR